MSDVGFARIALLAVAVWGVLAVLWHHWEPEDGVILAVVNGFQCALFGAVLFGVAGLIVQLFLTVVSVAWNGGNL